MKYTVLTLALLLLAACNSSNETADGGTAVDDSGLDDSGLDGGVTDAGVYSEDLALCQEMCNKMLAVGCADSIEGCGHDCSYMIATLPAGCIQVMHEFLVCTNNATIDCPDGGTPIFKTCDAQGKAVNDCLQEQADGGVDGADAGTTIKDGGYPTDDNCSGKYQWDPCTTTDYQGYCLNLQGVRQCVMSCSNIGEACPLGTCYPAGLTGWSACLETGAKQAGDSCAEVNDCYTGMICAGYNGELELCRPICSDSKPCTAGQCVDTQIGVKYCVVNP